MNKKLKGLLIPCMAAALVAGTSMISYAAVGWQEEDGAWHYYQNDGTKATDVWKKSGAHWFWLDSDGEMAVNSLIEFNDNFYYVNEDGARVTNSWRELENSEASDGEEATSWYYFDAYGKAYRAPDSGKTSFKAIRKADGSTGKYAFDDEGRLLYGWVSDESERLTDEDAWRSGVYYCGDSDDGAQVVNAWSRLEVEDDETEQEDFDGTYWFYFNSSGKKLTGTTKTINGKKYRFAENGNAEFNWYQTSSSSTASPGNMYYNTPDQCWQASGWFKAVPGESLDQEAYDNGDEYWFYANKSGELTKSQIKSINGQYYGFNEKGEMLHGLYKLSTSGRTILEYEEIETEAELPDADDDWEVYNFADSPKEGAMSTGTTKVDVDGESYTYGFKKSGTDKGRGYNGIEDGSIYIKGRLIKADKDSRYEAVEYDGNEYLVNTSGKIQKKKTNVKDADEMYYCTDAKGVITYRGEEKRK